MSKAKGNLVTIYILVYNNSDGLDKTISSVMEQDIADAEIIISDDGSKNYDTSILESYASRLREKYSSVRVNVNEVNIGTVKHLNRVFKMATGDILITCSSGDTFYDKDSVSKIASKLSTENELIVTTRRVDRYPDHDKIRPSFLIGIGLKLFRKSLIEFCITKRNVLSGCCTFYRKELFEKYGYHDERFHLVEDYPYYIMLLRKGVKFGWIGEPTIIHEIGGVSTGKVHPSIYKDIELMREDLYKERNSFSKRVSSFLEKCHAENNLEESNG